jgi:hypothetical protein
MCCRLGDLDCFKSLALLLAFQDDHYLIVFRRVLGDEEVGRQVYNLRPPNDIQLDQICLPFSHYHGPFPIQGLILISDKW